MRAEFEDNKIGIFKLFKDLVIAGAFMMKICGDVLITRAYGVKLGLKRIFFKFCCRRFYVMMVRVGVMNL
jgi:hypothetical protein